MITWIITTVLCKVSYLVGKYVTHAVISFMFPIDKYLGLAESHVKSVVCFSACIRTWHHAIVDV